MTEENFDDFELDNEELEALDLDDEDFDDLEDLLAEEDLGEDLA